MNNPRNMTGIGTTKGTKETRTTTTIFRALLLANEMDVFLGNNFYFLDGCILLLFCILKKSCWCLLSPTDLKPVVMKKA